MATIGRITVPEISPSGTFGLVSDYTHGQELAPEVILHSFGSANAKIEQRFWRGNGARRYRFVKKKMTQAAMTALVTFWEARSGAYQPFTYNVPADSHGGSPTAKTVRFADSTLTIEQAADAISSTGLIFEEIVDPDDAPTYTLDRTLTRFPDTALAAALLPQVQTVIPLVRIRVKEVAVDDIFLSDRRVTIGSQLYLPRLLTWNGIQQTRSDVDGGADAAVFEFGNADRVMTLLSQDTDLRRARIDFSLFHVDENVKLDLWSGEINSFRGRTGSEIFRVEASDQLRELNLTYPRRKISRRCWKLFDDGKNCPYSTAGSGGDPTTCDRGFDTVKGCQSHGMDDYFGGIIAKPQTVRIRDNGTSGRPTITASSIVGGRADSVYGEVLPEVYTQSDMPVPAKIVAGLDESDFFQALAVVCEGPIGAYATPVYPGSPNPTSKHKVDSQPWHGFKDGTNLGLDFGAYGPSLGPTPNPQPFGLSYTGDLRAAGTAFIAIRREDLKGIQLSQLEEHELIAVVSSGIRGFTWSAPGTRASNQSLDNPVWVLVNIYLRAMNLEFATAAEQEAFFDVSAALAEAAICNTLVNRIIGTGTVKQFLFQGILAEAKPLRDWLQEICNNFQGYYTFRFGKLRVGMRRNSSTEQAFTAGNMLLDSLDWEPIQPRYNSLRAYFADKEFNFRGNEVPIHDPDHAVFIGNGSNPMVLDAQMNLVGTSSQDQAARLVTTRLREELGGINEAQWKAAVIGRFRTTVLALAVEPGMVISVTHPDMPGGAGEGRVTSWRLNPDFSIDIEFRSTTDNMYDLTVGPKPADVTPDPVPGETTPGLTAANVTSLAAAEDPYIQADGTVASQVTVSYDEPIPLLAYAGVAIYLAPLDTDAIDGSGDPIEEPRQITRIQQNDLPGDRRFIVPTLAQVVGVSGAARIWAVSFSVTVENRLADSPTVDVLLDGKDSPPTPIANPWAQAIVGGIRFSHDPNPEDDLKEYEYADVGNLTPAVDASITDAHVVGRLSAKKGQVGRVAFDYFPAKYTGSSTGTVVTLSSDTAAKFFPSGAHVVGGVGKTVTFFKADGTTQIATVVSNTERTITFGAGLAPSGAVVFTITDLAGTRHLYGRAVDTTGNKSTWKPVPPAVLEISPLDIFGTQDKLPPLMSFNPSMITDASWFVVGQGSSIYGAAGRITVNPRGLSREEAQSNYDLALRQDIAGISHWEIEVIHAAVGGGGSATDYFQFGASNARSNYAHRTGILFGAGRWILYNGPYSIDLPNREVSSVRFRAHNVAAGWGPWVDGVGLFMPPGTPQYTGTGGALRKLETVSLSGSNYWPNLASAKDFRIAPLTATRTLKPPEYRTGSGTAGSGNQAVQLGEYFSVKLEQPSSGTTHLLTFDSAYKGVGNYPPVLIYDTYTCWTFRVDASNVFTLVAYVGGCPS